MKSTLTILVLFIGLISYAQSVPNTTTFSLQDVVDVVGGDDLNEAFSLSVDSYFDPAYKGDKTNLLNFRNYTPIVVTDVGTVTYANVKTFSSSEKFVSIEISNDGHYFYIVVNHSSTSDEIRRYTLSTNYNISTISSTYQSLYIDSWVTYDGSTKSPQGMYLSVDQKTIRLIYSHYLWEMKMLYANDLSSITLSNMIDISSNFASAYDIAYNPAETYLTLSGNGQGSIGDQTRTFTRSGGGLTMVSYSARSPRSVTGLEFNASGSKYYTMDIFNTAILLGYTVGTNNYKPDILVQAPSSTWNISSYLVNPLDFCFSDNIQHMYVLNNSILETYPKVYQFEIH